MGPHWYLTEQIDDELITFAVILTKYKGRYLIIHNRKRGGWEIPGGRREKNETLLQTACRELYEETGALVFNIAPFSTFAFNETFGMAFSAEVIEIGDLPEYEIEEIRFVDRLPVIMNFGELYRTLDNRWEEVKKDMIGWSYIDHHPNRVV
ncbi:NUDIX hydrolase [Paenibacillus thiaminolyticus]|uniref:NUDIX domain-containing protein n=1 Tax=Paenibacillus thiaminolyticus TaxID=49283 RepID=UPI00232DD40D|nr:NUDIX hydrolase [Paenibacillus thiaminolyticus]WCF08997.1 NUDIX hydrolase [Paenibacillus thiaminolyticus]